LGLLNSDKATADDDKGGLLCVLRNPRGAAGA